MYEKTKIELKLEELYKECGFNNSEQGTEDFVFALENAIEKTVKAIDRSHEEGLCLTSVAVLAGYLEPELSNWTINRNKPL